MFRLPLLALFCLVAACATDRTLKSGVDDTNIDLTLRQILFSDTQYNTNDVDITVFEGRVLLTGSVRSAEARREVAELASTIVGVREVLNEMQVGPGTTVAQGAQDALIDERLGLALVADNAVVRNNYKIVVSGGTVYLIGIAQNLDELNRATSHAQTVRGVTGVVSHVLFVRDPRRTDMPAVGAPSY